MKEIDNVFCSTLIAKELRKTYTFYEKMREDENFRIKCAELLISDLQNANEEQK